MNIDGTDMMFIVPKVRPQGKAGFPAPKQCLTSLKHRLPFVPQRRVALQLGRLELSISPLQVRRATTFGLQLWPASDGELSVLRPVS